MPLSLDLVRRIADRLTRPGCFFTGPDVLLGWAHGEEEIPWEVFQGRLLDLAHSRAVRRFLSWNVYRLPDHDALAPLLSLKLDPGAGRLYVVRGVEGYVHEGYDAGGAVYQSRERRKWLRELIATIALADFDDPDDFRQEVECALGRAVTGVRLPLNPIETPLPAFSFGELFYSAAPDDRTEERPSTRELPGHPLAGQTEPSRVIEAWLRAVPATDLPAGARELAARWTEAGRSGDDLLRTFRRLFNEVSLSPWTDFAVKVLTLLSLLQRQGTLTAAQVADFEGWLLRQLGRHLTAYDLVTFHHRGANYPDALLLDLVLTDYLARLESDPSLFLGEAGRLRRRALRQAWVIRRRYEGHPVPDVPTSPGEHARVFPEGYPRVAEDQILQIGRRIRRLYEGAPLVARLTPVVREALSQSVADLVEFDERQELAAAVFLDRPFGGGKAPVEPDGTLLLASLACSAAIAEQRLRSLAGDLGLAETTISGLIEGLSLPGLPLAAIGPPVRQGTLGLADAARTSPDFVFRFTLPGSVEALWGMLAPSPPGPLSHKGRGGANPTPPLPLWERGPGGEGCEGPLLLARVLSGSGLLVYDDAYRPRLELQPCLEQGYAARRGLEYPRAGVKVKIVE